MSAYKSGTSTTVRLRDQSTFGFSAVAPLDMTLPRKFVRLSALIVAEMHRAGTVATPKQVCAQVVLKLQVLPLPENREYDSFTHAYA